jgi:hypothetical protein
MKRKLFITGLLLFGLSNISFAEEDSGAFQTTLFFDTPAFSLMSGGDSLDYQDVTSGQRTGAIALFSSGR